MSRQLIRCRHFQIGVQEQLEPLVVYLLEHEQHRIFQSRYYNIEILNSKYRYRLKIGCYKSVLPPIVTSSRLTLIMSVGESFC